MDDNRAARSNRSTSTPTTSQSSSGRAPAKPAKTPAHVHPAKPPCRIHVRHLHGNSLLNLRGIRCRPLPFAAAS